MNDYEFYRTRKRAYMKAATEVRLHRKPDRCVCGLPAEQCTCRQRGEQHRTHLRRHDVERALYYRGLQRLSKATGNLPPDHPVENNPIPVGE